MLEPTELTVSKLSATSTILLLVLDAILYVVHI